MLRLHILRLAVVITFVISFNLDLAIGQSVLSHATGTIEDDSSHQLHWLFLPMVTRNSATIVGQISFLSESPSSSLGNSLYLINANGSNLYQIIDTVCSIHEYHWSSGGERILLTTNVGSCMDETTSEIFVVNADGTNLVRLTDNSHEEGQTKFSPD